MSGLSKVALKAMIAQKRDLVMRLFKEQSGFCPLCFARIDDLEDVDIDHILPKSKGGENRYRNYQLTHSDCNKIKQANPFNHAFYLELKRRRMQAWNVVLTRGGNFKSADFR